MFRPLLAILIFHVADNRNPEMKAIITFCSLLSEILWLILAGFSQLLHLFTTYFNSVNYLVLIYINTEPLYDTIATT
jgi:hypothetical protein